MPLTIAG